MSLLYKKCSECGHVLEAHEPMQLGNNLRFQCLECNKICQ